MSAVFIVETEIALCILFLFQIFDLWKQSDVKIQLLFLRQRLRQLHAAGRRLAWHYLKSKNEV